MKIKNISKSLLITVFFVSAASWAVSGADENVRPAAVAGTFYPSDPKKLTETIDSFVEKVPEKNIQGDILGFILPHAGYVFSGQTAAYGYKMIREPHPDTVILIGPYHQELIDGTSIWSSGAWKTPLGEVPIDEELAQAFLKENSRFHFMKEAHLKEHSLEVQVPFLQRSLPNFKILPILINDPHEDNTAAIAQTIVKHLKDKKVLIIASSDMSHYHDDATARKMDTLTLDLIKKQDSKGLLREFGGGNAELCGHAAVLTMLEISRLLGDAKIDSLNYSNSGDTGGDKERVVGYSASVVYESQEKSTGPLGAQQGKELLMIARGALVHDIVGVIDSDICVVDPALDKPRGVFVTLKKNGELRGCMGSLTSTEPLGIAVRQMTLEAALRDPRFPALSIQEANQVRIEISVLTEPLRIQNINEIIMGQHGVLLKQGSRGGVFLPKVAIETGWQKENFLNELCSQKAGLPPNCWKDPKTELYVFSSQDFSEEKS